MKLIDLKEYTVRMGSRKDAIKIIELINLIQPQEPWSYEHFMWQYYDSQPGDPCLYLIFHQDNLVSLYAAVKKSCYIQGEIKEGFMIQDVMTHPEYRGQGFLNYLSSLCVNNIIKGSYFAYTFPNKLSENSFRRNGWKELTKIPLRTMNVKNIRNREENILEQVNQFDHKVTKIWHDSGLPVGVHRDTSFLNWRYSRPETTYFKFCIKKDKGYLVLKLFDKGDTKCLHLLDIVVVCSFQEIIHTILKSIKAFASMKGAEMITCWLHKNHPYANTFDEFGFLLDPNHDRYSFVMAPDKDLEIFSSANLWHLTQGDSDVY
jgi:hypothetical protein